jgi:hypothetical protein
LGQPGEQVLRSTAVAEVVVLLRHAVRPARLLPYLLWLIRVEPRW